MEKRKSGLIAVFISFLVLTGCLRPPEKPVSPVVVPTTELITVHGTVYDQLMDSPLKDIKVNCSGVTTETDDEGYYQLQFNGQLGKIYSLNFSGDGYSGALNITPGNVVSRFDTHLMPLYTGLVEGHAYVTDYRPAANKAVEPLALTIASTAVAQDQVQFPPTIQPEEYLVFANVDAGEEISTLLHNHNITFRYNTDLDAYIVTGTEQSKLEELVGGLTRHIETNLSTIELLYTPTDPDYHLQWHYSLAHFPAAWDKTQGDSSITVAVIDSGVDLDHPDLSGALVPGWDFVDNDDTPDDMHGHGTLVAGIIAAGMNNGTGGVGAAPNVKIMPLRVFDEYGVTKTEWVVEAINYALLHNVQIINMSFGQDSSSFALGEVINRALQTGCIPVAAAGNEGIRVVYPAAFEGVIAVGAVDHLGQRAGYSAVGTQLDLLAPGGNRTVGVYSTFLPDGRYGANGYAYGTSFAAPHVAAAAALLMASGITQREEIYRRLTQSAIDLGKIGKDQETGYGILNIATALDYRTVSGLQVYMSRGDGTQQVHSMVALTDDNGTYQIKDLSPGEWQLTGWLDANATGIIDTGDYYGEGALITIKENQFTFTGVGLPLYPVE